MNSSLITGGLKKYELWATKNSNCIYILEQDVDIPELSYTAEHFYLMVKN